MRTRRIGTGLGLAVASLYFAPCPTMPAAADVRYQPFSMTCVRRIDRASLAGRERHWLDTVLWLGERMSEAASFAYGGIGGYNYPVPYVLSQLTGSYQEVPDFLDSQHKIESRADADAYVARLEAFAVNIGLEVEHARADGGRGAFRPPTSSTRRDPDSQPRGDGGARSGLVARSSAAPPSAASRAIGSAATAIVDGRIAARSPRQLALLTDRDRGGHSPASVACDGERFYNLCLRYHT